MQRILHQEPLMLWRDGPIEALENPFKMAVLEALGRDIAKHELIVMRGINHSFIGKTPEQTRDANLKALAATFQFIDQTIGNASSTTGSLSQRGGSQSVIRNRLISFGTNK